MATKENPIAGALMCGAAQAATAAATLTAADARGEAATATLLVTSTLGDE